MILPHTTKTLVRIYLFFRFTLSLVLLSTFFYYPSTRFLGDDNPSLFLWNAVAYFAICLASIALKPRSLTSISQFWILLSLTLDVVAMLIFMYASGGVESGLSYLILIFVAISGIFVRGQMAYAFAAMVSLLVVAESIYLLQWGGGSNKDVFSAGTLGILVFATTYLFQMLTERINASNQEAIRQASYAQHLQKLAQAIITRMRTGIVVIDHNGVVELINDSALQLMDLPIDVDYRDVNIREISALEQVVEQWQAEPTGGPPKVLELRAGQQARVSLSTLELGAHSRTVIYLEDHRVMTQQAQQLKLASLGRLTASIAHEVRNPLGAISHAAQLLEEAPGLSVQDKRLTQIIEQHSKRVNQIVESTLAMSRRKEPQPETLNLRDWLPRFLTQYRTGQNVAIDLQMQGQNHLVKMDPTHLSQILTNLLDNGLRYSQKNTGESRVKVIVDQSRGDETHYIDIVDYGLGITDDQLVHIFDPFFTTDEKGSGLGLYISKELCEINQATLHYRRTQDGLSCFRIDFSHYQRMF